jgi:hypothetical protein
MNEEDNTKKEAFEEDFEEEEDHALPFISSRKATRKEEEELRLSRFFFSLSRSSLSLVFFLKTDVNDDLYYTFNTNT